MSRKREIGLMAAGLLIGTVLAPTAAQAANAYLNAYPSTQTFYHNGQQVQLEAYGIDGYNYVKLGDLCPMLGVDLAYDGMTNSVYIGSKPDSTVTIPQTDEQVVLKEGDTVLCDDGSTYTITDMSRYNSNVFAKGPLPDLPTATCDWSKFNDVKLPPAETRHFTSGSSDTLFIRNLYETRRMQYTLYNALGKESSACKNGTPLTTVELTIPAELEAYTNSFWPWRASELEDLVHSRPNSQYYIEAWDYYLNGVFQYTRYLVCSI